MAADTPDPASGPQPTASDGMTRRELFRRGGTIGAGAIGTVAVGDRIVPQHSPIGRAHAIGLAAAGAFLAVGAIAGFAAGAWVAGDTKEIDTNDVLEDQIWEATLSVVDGREEFAQQMQAEFIDPPSAQETPFARSAWQEVRASAVRETVNGKTESEVLNATQDALDRQAMRSVANMVERWNTGLKALVQQLVVDYENSVGSYAIVDTTPTVHDLSADGMTAVDAAVPENESSSLLWKSPVDSGPIDATALEGREEPLEVLHIPFYRNSSYRVIDPMANTAWNSHSADGRANANLGVSHSDYGSETVYDTGLYDSTISRIETAYTEISNDLADYVSQIHSGVKQGAIDPADVLTSSDIFEEFADSNQRSRMAAELLAAGAHVPDKYGKEVTISHADLTAEELTGLLYPQFADSVDSKTVEAGTTIPASDYTMAYFGYIPATAEDGEYEVMALSGESDLEIVAVEDGATLEFTHSLDYVPDATNVDTEATIERLENLRQTVDELEAALDDDDDSGWGFNPFNGGAASALLGIGIIAAVIAVVAGVVTQGE